MTWADPAPFCLTCGHSWWHHCGFKEPGCTFLGDCSCVRFSDLAGTVPGDLMAYRIAHPLNTRC